MTLSISKGPANSDTKPDDQEYVEVGTEIGFDSRKIVKLWNALAKLALHIRLPESKDDKIPEYGNKGEIVSKVEEVLVELARLEMGTMTFSGIPDGGNVSFVCTCGETNKRRAKLLKDGQYVYCINPQCNETWKVQISGTEVNFENVLIDVPCKTCEAVNHIPWRTVTKMKYDEMLKYPCYICKGYNFVKWQLMQAARPSPEQI